MYDGLKKKEKKKPVRIPGKMQIHSQISIFVRKMKEMSYLFLLRTEMIASKIWKKLKTCFPQYAKSRQQRGKNRKLDRERERERERKRRRKEGRKEGKEVGSKLISLSGMGHPISRIHNILFGAHRKVLILISFKVRRKK